MVKAGFLWSIDLSLANSINMGFLEELILLGIPIIVCRKSEGMQWR